MLSIALRLTFGVAVAMLFSGVALLAARKNGSVSLATTPLGDPEPPLAAPVEGTPSPPDFVQISTPLATPTKSAGPAAVPAADQTSHGRLILDGHFAQRIGLLSALKEIGLPGKSVCHTPQERLVTPLVNILAGHTQLQEISRGDNPLRGDLVLAHAWDQRQFPEVSGVCRQLRELGWFHAEALRRQLQPVFAPYIALCQGPILARGEHLVVDWDLTAKRITTEAKSDPFAAFGHMEEGLGKGYQWAAAVLRGVGPDGQPRPVSLGGFLRPGNTHPPECVEKLRLITEETLGRPRRRPELLTLRLTASRSEEEERRDQVAELEARVREQQARLASLAQQLGDRQQRRAERTPEQKALLARDERALASLAERLARGQRRLEAMERRLVAARTHLSQSQQLTQQLQARLERLRADNASLEAGNQAGVSIEVVADAQFGSSETVTNLLEEGYDLTTKATSPASIHKLLDRQQRGERLFGPWEEVSANAQVAECTETTYARCPYPLRLLGYRKELAASASRPAETRYALFLTTVPAQERTARETVAHYHVRGGTVELINRQAKSCLGWRGNRLRHGPGLDVLGQFVFAAVNFVPWLADTVWAESGAEAGERPGMAELTQMARGPAHVLTDEAAVAIQFNGDGGWPRRILRLGQLLQPPLPGFVWPGVPINAQLPLQN
jgi:hypothetical protein